MAERRDNSWMRTWIYRLTLLMALLSMPLWAQRGGGGHGGGMGGGGGHMGGGGGGGYHGGSYGGGYHGGNYSGYRGGGYTAYHGGSWNGNGWQGGNGWNGRGWYGNGWYGNRWGWGGGWGYPYWGWGVGIGWGWGGYPYYGGGWYGDGGWGYTADMSTYTAAPAYAPSVVYVDPNGYSYNQPQQNPQTQQQIDQLQNQVAQLQAQQQRPSGATAAEVHYATVIVYRDGHTETVGNYAIVGKTLWIFDESRARKIPLSELDVPATRRDNQDRGNDFIVPSTAR